MSTPTKTLKKKGGLFSGDTLQRQAPVANQQERAKTLFVWRRFVGWAVAGVTSAHGAAPKADDEWAQWMAAQDEAALARDHGLVWRPGGQVVAAAAAAGTATGSAVSPEQNLQLLRAETERPVPGTLVVAARVSSLPSPALHAELRPVSGSLALFVATLAQHLGAAEVSVSVIPPSNRPVVNVPSSQPWPLESEMFEFLLWFRLYVSPLRMLEHLVELHDACAKEAQRQRGLVRLVLVWMLKAASLGESEALSSLMVELLARQTAEAGQHDYRKLAQQSRNARDGVIPHNEAVKRTQGSFSQHLTVRFISMTKIGRTDHFLVLEEVGAETVSKVLLLRACAVFARLFPCHLAQRVHVVLWGGKGKSESESEAQPLLQLVSHHLAVASWAAGVAVQSREAFAANAGSLAALAKISYKRGDAFTAAAVLQGLAHPCVARIRTSLPPKAEKRLVKLRVRLAPAAVFAETSAGIPASVESLNFDVLRQIGRAQETLLLCADRARSVIVNNNGPNLSSDKVPSVLGTLFLGLIFAPCRTWCCPSG